MVKDFPKFSLYCLAVRREPPPPNPCLFPSRLLWFAIILCRDVCLCDLLSSSSSSKMVEPNAANSTHTGRSLYMCLHSLPCAEDQRRQAAFVNFIFQRGVHQPLGFIVSPHSFALRSPCFCCPDFSFFPSDNVPFPIFLSFLFFLTLLIGLVAHHSQCCPAPFLFWYALCIAWLPANAVWKVAAGKCI